MQRSTLIKIMFSMAMLAVLVGGMVHLTATPAQALTCKSTILNGQCTLTGIEFVPPCYNCCVYDCPWGTEYFNCEATSPH